MADVNKMRGAILGEAGKKIPMFELCKEKKSTNLYFCKRGWSKYDCSH